MNNLSKFILIVSMFLFIYLLLYLTGIIFTICGTYWTDKIGALLWLTITFLFIVEIIHIENNERKLNIIQKISENVN